MCVPIDPIVAVAFRTVVMVYYEWVLLVVTIGCVATVVVEAIRWEDTLKADPSESARVEEPWLAVPKHEWEEKTGGKSLVRRNGPQHNKD